MFCVIPYRVIVNCILIYIDELMEVNVGEFCLFGYFKRDPTRKIWFLFRSVPNFRVTQPPRIDLSRIYHLRLDIMTRKYYADMLVNHQPLELRSLKLFEVDYEKYYFEDIGHILPQLRRLEVSEFVSTGTIKNIDFKSLFSLCIRSDCTFLELKNNNRFPILQRLRIIRQYPGTTVFLWPSWKKFPFTTLKVLTLWKIDNFNWTVFQTEEAKNLELIRLDDVYWSFEEYDMGTTTRNGRNPGVISWIRMPHLKNLTVTQCPEFSEKSLRFQTFDRLETFHFYYMYNKRKYHMILERLKNFFSSKKFNVVVIPVVNCITSLFVSKVNN